MLYILIIPLFFLCVLNILLKSNYLKIYIYNGKPWIKLKKNIYFIIDFNYFFCINYIYYFVLFIYIFNIFIFTYVSNILFF